MTMNRQSNLYTVIYSVVLVVIVGVVLSIVYQALRPQQEENIANDTKRQILAAALIVPSENRSVAELYSTHITDRYIVNTEGERVDANIDPFSVNVSLEVKKPAAERILPVFVCDTKSGVKYIVPVYGAGLWGPIWGYVAFNSDGDTIYGAYFAHQGETPGLGAEIEKPWACFQQPVSGERHLQFRGYVPISQSSEKRSGTDRGIICARNLRRHHNESGSSAHARKFSRTIFRIL